MLYDHFNHGYFIYLLERHDFGENGGSGFGFLLGKYGTLSRLTKES